MENENRTEQVLQLIANAINPSKVKEIVEHYRNDFLLDANAIIDAGIKRIEELD